MRPVRLQGQYQSMEFPGTFRWHCAAITFIFLSTFLFVDSSVLLQLNYPIQNFTDQYYAINDQYRDDISDTVSSRTADIPEEKVTYDGAQLWRVNNKDDKSQFLSYLQDKGGTYFFPNY